MRATAEGGAVDDGEVDAAAAELERFLATATTTPTRCTPSCSSLMQANVGIYRDEAGLTAAVAASRS